MPDIDLGSKISLIQVESLDFNVIGKKINNQFIAPCLTKLAAQSLILKMDGTKKLASANSDYELLNSKVVNINALYYSYIKKYDDSIIKIINDKGFETSVIHGLNGKYMNLKNTYPRMGFEVTYFSEDIEKYGYTLKKDMFMEQIPDKELLMFAGDKIKNKNNYLQFIITITMHGDTGHEIYNMFNNDEYYNTLYYFDSSLSKYIQSLQEDSTVIIYGDHQSYSGKDANGIVPFLIFKKNQHITLKTPETIFSRCEISHYLRRLFSNIDQEKSVCN